MKHRGGGIKLTLSFNRVFHDWWVVISCRVLRFEQDSHRTGYNSFNRIWQMVYCLYILAPQWFTEKGFIEKLVIGALIKIGNQFTFRFYKRKVRSFHNVELRSKHWWSI